MGERFLWNGSMLNLQVLLFLSEATSNKIFYRSFKNNWTLENELGISKGG